MNVFILAGLKRGAEFGIDTQLWVVDECLGVKFVPEGLHMFVFSGSHSLDADRLSSANGETFVPTAGTIAVRHGLFHFFGRGGGRVIEEWSNELEELTGSHIRGPRTQAPPVAAPDHGTLSVRDLRAMDRVLAAYQMDALPLWRALTSAVSVATVGRVVGFDEHGNATFDAMMERWSDVSGEATGDPRNQSRDEGKVETSRDSVKDEGQVGMREDTSSAQGDSPPASDEDYTSSESKEETTNVPSGHEVAFQSSATASNFQNSPTLVSTPTGVVSQEVETIEKPPKHHERASESLEPSPEPHRPSLSTSHSPLLYFTSLQLRQSWPVGATGSSRSRWSRDKSWALSQAVVTYLKGDVQELLGEMQLAFVMLVFVHNFASLDAYKDTVQMICRSHEILWPVEAGRADELLPPVAGVALCNGFLTTLKSQFEFLTPDFFATLLPGMAAFYTQELAQLRGGLTDAHVHWQRVAQNSPEQWTAWNVVLGAWKDLSNLSMSKFGWDIGHIQGSNAQHGGFNALEMDPGDGSVDLLDLEEGDDAPVIVDDEGLLASETRMGW